jgi:hypothetical protein
MWIHVLPRGLWAYYYGDLPKTLQDIVKYSFIGTSLLELTTMGVLVYGLERAQRRSRSMVAEGRTKY